MNSLEWIFILLASTLVLVTVQAWRMGQNRRDVALLGGCGGLFGAGAALSAWW